MKGKALLAVIAAVIFGLGGVAQAGTKSIKPGEETSCTDAKSITFEADGISSQGDRGNANAVVWKSANATTVPLTLGPTDMNSLEGDGHVGMADKHSMGHKSVTFTSQPEFSRGDSIGDISGLVKVTNTGTINLKVSCN